MSNEKQSSQKPFDRYDFAEVVDGIFKESGSLQDMVARYIQMKKDLDCIFQQNVALKGCDEDENHS